MNQTFNDLAFLTDSQKWPNYPICPVKNYQHTKPGSFPEMGIVVAPEGAGPAIPTVILCNMWSLVEAYQKGETQGIEKKEYNSLEELLADGWVVD